MHTVTNACLVCGGPMAIMHDNAGPWVCPGQVLVMVQVNRGGGVRLTNLWGHAECVRNPDNATAIGNAVAQEIAGDKR